MSRGVWLVRRIFWQYSKFVWGWGQDIGLGAPSCADELDNRHETVCLVQLTANADCQTRRDKETRDTLREFVCITQKGIFHHVPRQEVYKHLQAPHPSLSCLIPPSNPCLLAMVPCV